MARVSGHSSWLPRGSGIFPWHGASPAEVVAAGVILDLDLGVIQDGDVEGNIYFCHGSLQQLFFTVDGRNPAVDN